MSALMGDLLLGIDVGTSAVKAAAFDAHGRLIAEGTAPLTVHTPRAGWAEQHPDDWWAAAREAVRQVVSVVGAQRIAAVGVDGQSWAAVLIDGGGEVVCPTPIWMDQRSSAQCAALRERVGDAAFRLCGNPIQPGYTTPKLLWYQQEQPQAHARARHVLQSNGYVVYRLTGVLSQDVSQGYGLHCFDTANRTWDRAMARELSIDPDMLPPLCACHEIVGQITPEAARLTGLLAGTPVAAGGLDAACASLGAGVVMPGQTQEQGGQAGGMGLCVGSAAMDERLILSCHVAPDLWLLQGGTVGGGGALRWLREAVAGGKSFDELCEGAAQIPPGSEGVVFLPYLSGERSPIWDADARACFFGLTFSSDLRHMTRAVLEGVAFSLRHNIETAQQAGATVGDLHAMGGAARSPIWTQIKADITRRTMRVPEGGNETAMGAAMLAGVGTGVWKDAQTAADACVRFEREHKPSGGHADAYEGAYSLYRTLYPALKAAGSMGAHDHQCP